MGFGLGILPNTWLQCSCLVEGTVPAFLHQAAAGRFIAHPLVADAAAQTGEFPSRDQYGM